MSLLYRIHKHDSLSPDSMVCISLLLYIFLHSFLRMRESKEYLPNEKKNIERKIFHMNIITLPKELIFLNIVNKHLKIQKKR